MEEQVKNTAVADVLSDSSNGASLKAGKYLTFRLEEEEYGINILQVTTIIRLQEITAVPNTPHYVRGVINLRGNVIPVVEMRTKFRLETVEETNETCIIVVDIRQGDASIPMGILVDSVSEVLDVADADIEEIPDFGDNNAREGLLGIAKIDDDLKILLDIDRVLASEASELV